MDSIALCDLLIISLAEHNGSYSASFKNILDWASESMAKYSE
ncbi:MAG: NAD(P)H-dependent oxidoreductase [Saprospiraceae bacterium]|nr:NAD(P)H-dependent oxidoreductase [Saprospiraceae bacterium]